MSEKVSQTGKNRRKRPRTCVGCKKEEGKRGLLRVVRSPEGEVKIDYSGKTPGRGAYLCRNIECLRAAKKQDALSKALKRKVPREIYEELEKLCSGEETARNEPERGESDF
ncbi:MAG: RNase P modulator RnpM [Thermovirgaceae bacterium]